MCNQRSRIQQLFKAAGAMAVAVSILACSSSPGSSVAPSTAAGASVAASTAPPAVAPIKVGKLSPLTGGLALLGAQQLHGAELAVEEINAAGGIKSMGGAPLELIVGDTQGAPETGGQEAERLMDEGSVALIGAIQSAVTFVTTQAAARRGIPHVVDEGVSDSITNRGFNNIFRITYSADSETRQLVDWLRRNEAITGTPIKTLVVMNEDSLFGQSIGDAFVRNLAGSGLEMLERIQYPGAAADLSTQIARVKSKDPDVLIQVGYLTDGILMARAAEEQQLRAALYGLGSGGFSNPNFVKELGSTANYTIDLNLGVSLEKPEAAALAEAYNAKYPEDGWNHHAVYSYVAVKVLADALERAGTSDSIELLRALRETQFTDHPLPQDAIIFDAKGENINGTALIFQVLNEKIEIVQPEEFATAKMVYPIPPWGQR